MANLATKGRLGRAVGMFSLMAISLPAGGNTPPKIVSHCDETEQVVFSCDTASGGKTISVCANAAWTTLEYRFGRRGAVERTSPPRGAASLVRADRQTWARGWEDSLIFPGDDGVVYRVVWAMGSGIDGEGNHYAGVKVEKDGKELTFVRCAGSSADGIGLDTAAAHLPAKALPKP